MRFIIQIIVIAVFALVAQLLMPWWGVLIAAAAGGFAITQAAGRSFLAGFFGVALLWFLQTYLADSANESILSDRVAGIFTFYSGFMMILVSALIGGICGGIGALLGRSLRGLV